MPTITQEVAVTVEKSKTIAYGAYVSFGRQLSTECPSCFALTLRPEAHSLWHTKQACGNIGQESS